MPLDYPAARFMIRYGHLTSILVALGLIIIGVWSVLEGAPYWACALFLGAAAAAYLLLRSYSELVRILFDILIPE